MIVYVMKTTASAHVSLTIHVLHKLNAMLLLTKLFVCVLLVMMVTLSRNAKLLAAPQTVTVLLIACVLMVVVSISVFTITNVPLKHNAAALTTKLSVAALLVYQETQLLLALRHNSQFVIQTMTVMLILPAWMVNANSLVKY